jgi:hypothetical protein
VANDDARLENKWVPIFRAGQHTSAEGLERAYTESDLDHIVRAYNPDYHEAPAVVGHPENNAPAYGWVKGLKREGSTLLARFGQVNPDFEQMVKSGAFKKRSASFYVKPSGLELRHVAFLGAQPPAVKGLAAIKFEEGNHAEIDFQEELMAGHDRSFDNASFTEADMQRLIAARIAPLKARLADLKTKIDRQTASFVDPEELLSLLKAGRQGDKELTQDDLDSIVSNFKGSGTKKIPVVFGRPSENGPQLAQIDGLQRKGDTLNASLSGIDPRLQKLLDAGLLKKRSVQIKGHGMPEGPSITGVGLIHRQPGTRGVDWEDCPGTEAGLDAICEHHGDVSVESQFADRSAGVTHVVFEEFAFQPQKRKSIDVNGERLTALAKERADRKSISFGEALAHIAMEQPELTVRRDTSRARRPYDRNGERLTALAKARADQKSISFGEALTEVAGERPDLTVPSFEFRDVEVRR